MRTGVAISIGLASLMLGLAGPAWSQEGPGGAIKPQRDCQTLLTCNYKKGGSYRGCLSSYSCRRCEFVTAKCTIADRRF